MLFKKLVDSIFDTVGSISKEERKRRNTPCGFNDGISKKEFEIIVKLALKDITRIKKIIIRDTWVYCMVSSRTNLSTWEFSIDYNDYGHITGNYWLENSNSDSGLPRYIANQISDMIKRYPECLMENYDTIQSSKKTDRKIQCPYCGQCIIPDTGKFCSHCGRILYLWNKTTSIYKEGIIWEN